MTLPAEVERVLRAAPRESVTVVGGFQVLCLKSGRSPPEELAVRLVTQRSRDGWNFFVYRADPLEGPGGRS
jgi:hypothetical protein